MVAVAAHEVNAGGAGRSTIKHQLDVDLFDMGTALNEAVARQHLIERRLTCLAVFQAVLHGSCLGCHGFFSVKRGSNLAKLPSWMECNLHTIMGYHAV